MSQSTRRIYHGDGRVEEITDSNEIILHLSPAQRAELYRALKKQEEEKQAERFEAAYQSSIPIVQELHRRMEQREIDDVAERLIRSAHE
jgi:hypothetical protein